MEFNFSQYEHTQKYFYFFDTYIKNNNDKKEELFEKLNITGSTYRRARNNESKAGKMVIKSLCDYYKIIIPDIKYIKELEKLVTEIYNKMYYKSFDSYDKDLNTIKSFLEENTIFKPVLQLIKMFMEFNSYDVPKEIRDDELKIFYELVKYEKFFTDELKHILEILKLYFDEEYMNNIWEYNYQNPMAYQLLASKCFMRDKYIEAIFYASKAKDILLQENNFKRFIVVNRMLLTSMLCAKNYHEVYRLINMHKLSISVLDLNEKEIVYANNIYYASMLGLEMYDKIIEELKDAQKFNLSQFTCLLVSLYKKSKKLYYEYVKDIEKDLNANYLNYINHLTKYLENKNKEIFNTLKSTNVMKGIQIILKKF